MSNQSDEPGSTSRINRRRVLQAAGSAVVGAGALSGAASAHTATDVVFCGCSQVCACGNEGGGANVVVVEGSSVNKVWRDFPFCYEVESGKIVAIITDDTYTLNPNTCAEKSIAEFGYSGDYGKSGGPCGDAFLRKVCGASND